MRLKKSLILIILTISSVSIVKAQKAATKTDSTNIIKLQQAMHKAVLDTLKRSGVYVDSMITANNRLIKTLNAILKDKKRKQDSGYAKNALKICINDSVILRDVKNSIAPDADTVAAQKPRFLGALYSAFPGVRDDNPAGLVQSYYQLSIPVRRVDGFTFPSEKKEKPEVVPFRNCFIQLTTSIIGGKNLNLPTFDSVISGTRKKFVNNLDLLQYSTLNGSVSMNLVTLIFPKKYSVYLDVIGSILRTTITDSISGKSATTSNISSTLWGVILSIKSYFNSQFNAEITGGIVGIGAMTDSYTSGLNFQHANAGDLKYDPRPLTYSNPSTKPYYSVAMLIKYNTSHNNSNSSNIYLHFASYSNIISTPQRYLNAFVQIQIGYALDVTSLFVPKGSSSKSSKVTN